MPKREFHHESIAILERSCPTLLYSLNSHFESFTSTKKLTFNNVSVLSQQFLFVRTWFEKSNQECAPATETLPRAATTPTTTRREMAQDEFIPAWPRSYKNSWDPTAILTGPTLAHRRVRRQGVTTSKINFSEMFWQIYSKAEMMDAPKETATPPAPLLPRNMYPAADGTTQDAVQTINGTDAAIGLGQTLKLIVVLHATLTEIGSLRA